jgi:hypothetical protein
MPAWQQEGRKKGRKVSEWMVCCSKTVLLFLHCKTENIIAICRNQPLFELEFLIAVVFLTAKLGVLKFIDYARGTDNPRGNPDAQQPLPNN